MSWVFPNGAAFGMLRKMRKKAATCTVIPRRMTGSLPNLTVCLPKIPNEAPPNRGKEMIITIK